MPTVSYDVTAQQVTRINDAVGKILNLRGSNGLPRAATAAEARAYHIALLRSAVVAVAALSVSDLVIA